MNGPGADRLLMVTAKDVLVTLRSRFHLNLPHNGLCASELIELFTNKGPARRKLVICFASDLPTNLTIVWALMVTLK